jgi:CrcB protein
MLFVALGGVVGSLFRYLLSEIFPNNGDGTLWANLIGVTVATIAVEYCKLDTRIKVRNFLLPGFCGGLTTFSSAILLGDQFGYSYLIETLLSSFLVISFFAPIAKSRFRTKS